MPRALPLIALSALLLALPEPCTVGLPPGGQVAIGDFAIDRYEFPGGLRVVPAHNVSFPEAQEACKDAGKRLCTIWEWQAACAGAAGHRYPYGDAYDDGACHTSVGLTGHTSTGVAAGLSRTGLYPRCVSDDGVYDLSGNVEEWVDGFHNGQRGILMGGAWYTYDQYADCTGLYSRSPMYRMRPQEKVFSAGFRCCTGPPVSEEELRAFAEAEEAAQAAAGDALPPDPGGMVAVGGTFIDRYEYPNVPGALPRVHVTFREAELLCDAVDKRLCTADEWEAACRSGAGEDYPYGRAYDGAACNTEGAGPAPAGSRPSCESGAGAVDMSGNVWEWTAERIDLGAAFGPDHDRRVVRGGSWYDHVSSTSCGYSQGYFAADPRFGYREVGFRCCRDEAPSPDGSAEALAQALDPRVREVGEAVGSVRFTVTEASLAALPGDAAVSAVSAASASPGREDPVGAADPGGASAGCPEGMVRAGSVCIDAFEYPGVRGELPRAQVSPEDAARLCADRSARLCTAAEWTRACQGPSGRRWPYGDAYDRTACNYGFTGGAGSLRPAGDVARCVSEEGAFDLSGNLWEWVSDRDAEGKVIMLGGYWNLGATYGRCDTSASAPEGFSHPTVGFRCCAEPR